MIKTLPQQTMKPPDTAKCYKNRNKVLAVYFTTTALNSIMSEVPLSKSGTKTREIKTAYRLK